MKCTVLSPFPFSFDGVNTRDLYEGDEVDFPDELVAGLKAEKLIIPIESDEQGVATDQVGGIDDVTEMAGTDAETAKNADTLIVGVDKGAGDYTTVVDVVDVVESGAPVDLEIKVVEPPEIKDGSESAPDDTSPTVDDSDADETSVTSDDAGEKVDDEIAELRAVFKEDTGQDADKRWSVETLREKLAEKETTD